MSAKLAKHLCPLAKCAIELPVACRSWIRAAFGALDDNVAGSDLDAGNETGIDKDTRRQTPKNTLRGVGWQGYRLGNLRRNGSVPCIGARSTSGFGEWNFYSRPREWDHRPGKGGHV
ncbi:MAG: hypothetical protein F4X40_03250 [Chloroflexi bacterium]|nr:hypothetical protein [Chloroflexota bacterium]